ncbi:unnamed protein product [Peronospora effusa]|nr:unnamed protein product [Peronospora effusa]
MYNRLNKRRGDHSRQALELKDFASTFEQLAQDYKRWVGHIKRNCKKKADFLHAAVAMSVSNGHGASTQIWILDSAASRHLIMDLEMLVDAKDCDDSCEVADGQTIKVSKVGSVNILASVDGELRRVTISNVYNAECLAHNLLLYRELEKKGAVLSYNNGQRYLKRTSDGAKGFEVMKKNNVLTLNVKAASTTTVRGDIDFAVVRANDLKYERDITFCVHCRTCTSDSVTSLSIPFRR